MQEMRMNFTEFLSSF